MLILKNDCETMILLCIQQIGRVIAECTNINETMMNNKMSITNDDTTRKDLKSSGIGSLYEK